MRQKIDIVWCDVCGEKMKDQETNSEEILVCFDLKIDTKGYSGIKEARDICVKCSDEIVKCLKKLQRSNG